jgi:hypothetical protein
MSSNAADAAEVFIYTGAATDPFDVIRLRVDPSVTSIPDQAFYGRKKLTEVELCEGLVEIGGFPSHIATIRSRKSIFPTR